MTLQRDGTLGTDPPRPFATRPAEGGGTELVCLTCEAAAPNGEAFIAHVCPAGGDAAGGETSTAEQISAPRPRRGRAAEPTTEE